MARSSYSAERISTEDTALRRIAREDRTPGDYYADKAADVLTLREALASLLTLNQERARRARVIARNHGKTLSLAMLADARAADTLQHCDCSRCSLPRAYRDQWDHNGEHKGAARVREALERARYVGD